jgi:hypothetical protein
VARHVGNILARLGFQSRAQIAAWMAENDPPGSTIPRGNAERSPR